jgi:hypothetical protein
VGVALRPGVAVLAAALTTPRGPPARAAAGRRAVHAQAAAAIFTLVASCRLHRLDPLDCLTAVLRVLPYWPDDRYIELAPKSWAATRALLDDAELQLPLGDITVRPPANA